MSCFCLQAELSRALFHRVPFSSLPSPPLAPAQQRRVCARLLLLQNGLLRYAAEDPEDSSGQATFGHSLNLSNSDSSGHPPGIDCGIESSESPPVRGWALPNGSFVRVFDDPPQTEPYVDHYTVKCAPICLSVLLKSDAFSRFTVAMRKGENMRGVGLPARIAWIRLVLACALSCFACRLSPPPSSPPLPHPRLFVPRPAAASQTTSRLCRRGRS